MATKSDGRDFADPDGPAPRLTYTDEKIKAPSGGVERNLHLKSVSINWERM
jgi:hypothetical protein